MNLNKSKIISTITIFALCFLFHFGYDLLPSSITAIFFPVNESIWEHMKMLFTAIIFNGIIDYFVMKKWDIEFNNLFLGLFVSAFSSIPIYLMIYLPFYYKIGAPMILNIGVLFIAIVLSQVINYFIQKRSNIKIFNIASVVLIIICYIIFGYLTYNPIRSDIFFDPMDEKYGIHTYKLSD